MASPSHTTTTTDYLHLIGMVFKACRGTRTVADIARDTQGRLSRTTIERLERGATEITLRSQIELADFYGLTLADLHREAWALLSDDEDSAAGGSLTLTISAEERKTILHALTKTAQK